MKFPALITATLLALGGATIAQAEGGYFGVQVGANDTDDTSFQTALGTIDTTFDGGLTYAITAGRSFDGFRFEGELARREADVDTHSLGGTSLAGATGEANTTSLMANFYYDFGNDGRVTPYLGAGFGLATVDLPDFGVAVVPNVLDADDDVFAYQAIAGLDIELSDTLSLTLDARYFETEDASVTTSLDTGSVATSVAYTAMDARVGLRFRF